jgi:hypothetical protein
MYLRSNRAAEYYGVRRGRSAHADGAIGAMVAAAVFVQTESENTAVALLDGRVGSP